MVLTSALKIYQRSPDRRQQAADCLLTRVTARFRSSHGSDNR